MNRRGDRKFRPQVTLGKLQVLYIRGGGAVEGRGRGGEGSRDDLRRFWAVITDIHKFINHSTTLHLSCFCKKRVTKNKNKNVSTGYPDHWDKLKEVPKSH